MCTLQTTYALGAKSPTLATGVVLATIGSVAFWISTDHAVGVDASGNPPEEVWVTVGLLRDDAEHYLLNGCFHLAEQYYKRAFDMATKHFGDAHWVTKQLEHEWKQVAGYDEWPDDRRTKFAQYVERKAQLYLTRKRKYYVTDKTQYSIAEEARRLAAELGLERSADCASILVAMAEYYAKSAKDDRLLFMVLQHKVAILREIYGEDNPDYVATLAQCSDMLLQSADPYSVERLLRDLYQKSVHYVECNTNDPSWPHRLLTVGMRLITWYQLIQDTDSAKDLVEHMESVYRRAPSPSPKVDEWFANVREILGSEKSNGLRRAEAVQRLLTLWYEFEPTASQQAILHTTLADALCAAGETDGAYMHLMRTWSNRGERISKMSPWELAIYGKILLAEGSLSAAETALDAARAASESAQEQPIFIPLLESCAEVKKRLGKVDDVIVLDARINAIRERIRQHIASRKMWLSEQLPK